MRQRKVANLLFCVLQQGGKSRSSNTAELPLATPKSPELLFGGVVAWYVPKR